ncbi:M50 family metallopeptidase [Nitriliruptor alkaliphilus]|uniref:M50 family metallopeptidase n=1 Tax=Nitriliruptor alkaliphilus TaxID=427918 RepID=UPI0006966C57|nr:M50 family metallopeptidase [Nitriliruptor alkaliphilus]
MPANIASDTAGMWILVRVLALLVLVAAGLLVAGRGELLLDVVDALLAAVGVDEATPRSEIVLAWPVVAGGVGVGVAVASVRPGYRLVGQVVTLLHEFGHTVVAAALGARPSGIVLRHDASGHATARWVGRPTPARRLALAAVAFAGVPATAATAAVGAQLLLLVDPEAVLWSFAAVGLTVAVLARSPWSLLIAVGLAGLAWGALHDAVAPWTVVVVVAMLVALAVTATRRDLRALRTPIQGGDDARVVGRQLRLPARVVQLVQIAFAGVLSTWTVWLLATAA